MDFKILSAKFDIDEKCLTCLKNLCWGMTKKSPQCDFDKLIYYAAEKRYVCNNCHKKFSVVNGTMFEHTRYPLTDWFKVITLILKAKQGISAMNIMSNMDYSYKTAYYLAMRMHCAMIEQDIMLQNIVEFDEALYDVFHNCR